jgi:hypothetical protein
MPRTRSRAVFASQRSSGRSAALSRSMTIRPVELVATTWRPSGSTSGKLHPRRQYIERYESPLGEIDSELDLYDLAAQGQISPATLETLLDLFKNGAVCLDQPGLYAGKDVLVATFFERQRLAIQAFTSADDKTLQAENPAEGRFKEMFPTIGGAVAFLLAGHVMMHLGQISGWRRAMGLGSAS